MHSSGSFERSGTADARPFRSGGSPGARRRASRRRTRCPRRRRRRRFDEETFRRVPSASRTVPMASGRGTPATKLPNGFAARPRLPSRLRVRPPLRRAGARAGWLPARQGEEPIIGTGRETVRRKRAPRPVSSAFKGNAGEMRADDGEFDLVAAERLDGMLRGTAGAPVAPSRHCGLRMQSASDGRDQGVLARRRDERDARRQAIGPETSRNGDGAEVEKIHEVRVGPEFRVGPRSDRGRGRRAECGRGKVGTISTSISRQTPFGGATQFGEPIEAREGIGRGKARCASDDRRG